MESGRRNALMWRWSLILSGAIALFWAIYYFVMNDIPAVASIRLSSNDNLFLPFHVSRWFDVLLGPLWAISTFYAMSKDRREDGFPALFGLAYGLVLGLMSAENDLFVGCAIGGLFGFLAGALLVNSRELRGSWFSLYTANSLVLFCGLYYGLVGGLIIFATSILSAGFGVLIGFLLTPSLKNIWEKTIPFLSASDKKSKE